MQDARKDSENRRPCPSLLKKLPSRLSLPSLPSLVHPVAHRFPFPSPTLVHPVAHRFLFLWPTLVHPVTHRFPFPSPTLVHPVAHRFPFPSPTLFHPVAHRFLFPSFALFLPFPLAFPSCCSRSSRRSRRFRPSRRSRCSRRSLPFGPSRPSPSLAFLPSSPLPFPYTVLPSALCPPFPMCSVPASLRTFPAPFPYVHSHAPCPTSHAPCSLCLFASSIHPSFLPVSGPTLPSRSSLFALVLFALPAALTFRACRLCSPCPFGALVFPLSEPIRFPPPFSLPLPLPYPMCPSSTRSLTPDAHSLPTLSHSRHSLTPDTLSLPTLSHSRRSLTPYILNLSPSPPLFPLTLTSAFSQLHSPLLPQAATTSPPFPLAPSLLSLSAPLHPPLSPSTPFPLSPSPPLFSQPLYPFPSQPL
ncbi:unnamed protein product [Closterium sp. Naga37s-1]|nr:unnamed protein product [Closterium sp. Naga37s-1]